MNRIIIRGMLTVVVLMSYTAYSAAVHNLYSDHRAMKVDDILTILIVESAKAGSESKTATSKQNDIGAQASGTGALSFIPQVGVNGGMKVGFDGRGGTSREGNLEATISARVLKVMDNGNLVIEGSKVVEINDEKEIIKINGIVRPQDILQNNIVYSSSVADAQITYAGKGVANSGRRPGVVARILNWIF